MPPKRPARKRNQKSPRQRGRRESTPNVYVQGSESRRQEDAPTRATAAVPAAAGRGPSGLAATSGGTPVITRARSGQRRQGRQRSEVFARSLPAELRKLSILVAAVAVALAVLTVVLR